jgi:4-hydroxy-3-methylbut-2-enyl diphosphate reductase
MHVLIARPRGFCAGVVRAIEIVERALETYGGPLYVLHEIVHNHWVVADLRRRGAVFVEGLIEVPARATIVFSAHGVPASTLEQARDRGLRIIDATCPLVAKVHLEVARHARAGREVVLVGHAGHPEVIGTLGCYPRDAGGAIHLVQSVADVQTLDVNHPEALGYVTQTTLSVDDTGRIIEALHRRYPAIRGAQRDDICYATQNRQDAVRAMAGRIDTLLVVGASNSSNSNRLREVGSACGVASYRVQDAAEIDRTWLRGVSTVGVTAGASTPEVLVEEVLARLRGLGASVFTELDGVDETISFRLPSSLLAPHGRTAQPSPAKGP